MKNFSSFSIFNRPLLSSRLSIWLYGNCFLLLAMIALGGITRLSGSGLSIAEWDPILGMIPPIFQEQWDVLFNNYMQTPEFQKVNFMFTLDDFKSIFWLEYFHRLLGRLLGITFIVPGIIFWIKGYLYTSLKKSFVMISLLGLLQGAMGWYMVKSGLVKDPHVSHFRLAAHLLLALIIYAWILWEALAITTLRQPDYYVERTFRLILVFVLGTITYGALVAGLKAGVLYNTFPLMDGEWFPVHLMNLSHERYFIYDPVNVQVIHRCLAIILTVWIVSSSLYYITEVEDRHLKKTFWALQGLVLLQFLLGVSTLVLAVPVTLACLHQIGAVMLLSGVIYVLHYTSVGSSRFVQKNLIIKHLSMEEFYKFL